MPVKQTVIVQFSEGVPALLNLYLVFAVSVGTVRVSVHDGSAARVTCEPSATMVPGATSHPDTLIVADKFVPIVEIVTG